MERLPTKAAEEIYDILIKYADADPDYYHRELFIYHFGLKKGMRSFSLQCMDGKRKYFVKENDEYKLVGKGENKVNSIIRRLLK
jgi:hypothetical protein